MILLIINLNPKTVKYSLTERGGNLSTKEIPNIPSNAELENLADLYRAMGDNTRMHLLWSLMSGEACVGALASDMDITVRCVSPTPLPPGSPPREIEKGWQACVLLSK